MSEELKPCPKCKHIPYIIREGRDRLIKCCGISSGLVNGDTNAIELWNEAVSEWCKQYLRSNPSMEQEA